jgi:integrase
MRKNLNEDMIASLTASGGRVELSDTKCRGLQLRVGARGDKSFSVVCRLKGTGIADPESGKRRAGAPQRIPIGTWPTVSLEAARVKAVEVINAAQRGEAHGAGGASPLTLAVLIDKYVKAKKRDGIRTWAKVESELTRHVVPKFGSVAADKITRKAVHEYLDAMRDDDLPGAAREVRKHLVSLLNWAEDRGHITVNPLRGMQRKDLGKNPDAGRALTDAELAAIWKALPRIGYPYGDLIKLWMLTGQRRSDWSQARSAEIDKAAATLEIPRNRYKGQRDHIVPLCPYVVQIVDALPKWDAADFLFSTSDTNVPFSGFSKAKTQLDAIVRETIPQLENWRIHDLRVTCKTRLAKLKVPSDVRDAVLGHAKQGLDRIYDKHERLDEKREALELFAAHILSVVEVRS